VAFLGKVFGEFGDLTLAPERRNEKRNNNKKELHKLKRVINICGEW
jgi:hypothetical protein